MDLTRATSRGIGSVLDRAGVTWTYDDDGDIRVRFRSRQQPWTDVVSYQLTADFSLRGQFLNGRAVPQANGMTRWEVDRGHLQPSAVAQKVVTVYLIPHAGYVRVQVHAAIAPLDQPRPMHIKVIPGSQQVSRIERAFPGFIGTGDSKAYWMSGAPTGTHVEEQDFLALLSTARQVGLDMFDGPFTGWMYSRDI